MLPDFLQRRDPEHPLTVLRMRVRLGLLNGDTEAFLLNEGTPWEEPLTVEVALAFGERLWEAWLP